LTTESYLDHWSLLVQSVQSKQESLLHRLDELDRDNDALRSQVAELEESRDQLQQLSSQLTDDKHQLQQQINDNHVTNSLYCCFSRLEMHHAVDCR